MIERVARHDQNAVFVVKGCLEVCAWYSFQSRPSSGSEYDPLSSFGTPMGDAFRKDFWIGHGVFPKRLFESFCGKLPLLAGIDIHDCR